MKAVHPEVVAATRVNPGETLRQARENKNWSLPDVALRMNLTVTSLSNLEAGDFDKLPGHTFARGYVRAYAKLLELDQTALVNQFDQYTGTDGKGSAVHALGRIEEPVRLSHNILRIVSLLLLVVLVGGGFLWWQDQASQRGKDPVSLTPEHVEVESADGTTQIHPLDEPEDQAVTESLGSNQSSLPLNTGTPATEAPSSAPAPAAPSTSANVPLHTPTTPSVPARGTPAVPGTPATTPDVTEAAPEIPAGAGQVAMQFTADCWTQVTEAGGKVLFSGMKRKGDSLNVNGKPPLTLLLGHPPGVSVNYNGQPVDLSSFTNGKTARLKVGQ
ncbi:RodZ family helix-turn-helix domain-containing protein [Pseudomonas sp. G.S.17]|uniref:RodZ family helix-turn-helix domain-containing protein n=1 Tax=Pseudomonas sp. G.S.17 TaxID=3137451 RepID=UPI00311CA260